MPRPDQPTGRSPEPGPGGGGGASQDAGRLQIVPAGGDSRALAGFRPDPEMPLELSDFDRRLSRGWVLASFLLAVIAPVLAAGWFLTSVASDRFTAEFRVAVRSSQAAVFSGMGDLIGFPGASRVGKDSQVLVQFLQSRAIIEDLQDEVPIRQMFSAPGIDPVSRLAPDAPIERLVKYWNDRVNARFEAANSTVVVRVTAFAPADALRLSQSLLRRAESFVNTLSEQARQDAVLFARREVANAEARLTRARLALAGLQNRENVLDPVKSGESSQALAAKLREQIARQRAILATQKSQLSDDAPSVRATRNVIAGLEAELRRVDATATAQGAAPDAGRPLNAVIREYQAIASELSYAEGAYASALSSLEAARIDASRKQIYLATVVAPGLPEERVFPRPLPDVLLVGSIALALWLIGLLVVYSIREHR